MSPEETVTRQEYYRLKAQAEKEYAKKTGQEIVFRGRARRKSGKR